MSVHLHASTSWFQLLLSISTVAACAGSGENRDDGPWKFVLDNHGTILRVDTNSLSKFADRKASGWMSIDYAKPEALEGAIVSSARIFLECRLRTDSTPPQLRFKAIVGYDKANHVVIARTDTVGSTNPWVPVVPTTYMDVACATIVGTAKRAAGARSASEPTTEIGSVGSSSGCLWYDDTLAMTGVLEQRVYPGRPGYASVDSGDEPEAGYYVVLDSVACVRLRPNQPPTSDAVAVNGAKLLQLLLNQSDYERLRSALGQRVSVRGMVFSALTGHHHAPLLMSAPQVTVGTDMIR